MICPHREPLLPQQRGEWQAGSHQEQIATEGRRVTPVQSGAVNIPSVEPCSFWRKLKLACVLETTTKKHRLVLKNYPSLFSRKSALASPPEPKAFSFYENVLKAEVSTTPVIIMSFLEGAASARPKPQNTLCCEKHWHIFQCTEKFHKAGWWKAVNTR